jgi:SAM-dependent MidA family methyltransferase
MAEWLASWWPLDGREPGARAEIGTTRDRAWAGIVAGLGRGMAVAIDYGHVRRTRPPTGSLRSYRQGRQVPVVPDGSCDVTADVAVDAVAAAVSGRVLRQRDALAALGVTGVRPPRSLSATDPAGYARRLSASTAAADLRAVGGLGDYYWVVSAAGGSVDVLGEGALAGEDAGGGVGGGVADGVGGGVGGGVGAGEPG